MRAHRTLRAAGRPERGPRTRVLGRRAPPKRGERARGAVLRRLGRVVKAPRCSGSRDVGGSGARARVCVWRIDYVRWAIVQAICISQ